MRYLFWIAFGVLSIGPFVAAFVGLSIQSLSEALGYGPIRSGMVEGLGWAPILIYITWPIAFGLLVLGGVVFIVRVFSKK